VACVSECGLCFEIQVSTVYIRALYTQGEVTSQSLRSRHDRHFVGITRHNALSYMAKIYRVIPMKRNQLVQENVHMITDLPTKRI